MDSVIPKFDYSAPRCSLRPSRRIAAVFQQLQLVHGSIRPHSRHLTPAASRTDSASSASMVPKLTETIPSHISVPFNIRNSFGAVLGGCGNSGRVEILPGPVTGRNFMETPTSELQHQTVELLDTVRTDDNRNRRTKSPHLRSTQGGTPSRLPTVL